MKTLGKFLALILRHKPETVGLKLNKNGWIDVDQLIRAINSRSQFNIDRKTLEMLVKSDDKQRYAFSDDNKIRANQGHSKQVDLQLNPVKPPNTLYHGTVEKFLNSITKEGLNKGRRQHVHLSKDVSTATNVGQRRGEPVVLEVDSRRMVEQGFEFFISKNNVYLIDHVPAKFLKIYNF